MMNYELPKISYLTLTVYDASGRVVATLVKALQQPGSYRVEWPACRTESGRDGSNFSSGVYFYKLSTKSYEQTRKMVLIK